MMYTYVCGGCIYIYIYTHICMHVKDEPRLAVLASEGYEMVELRIYGLWLWHSVGLLTVVVAGGDG